MKEIKIENKREFDRAIWALLRPVCLEDVITEAPAIRAVQGFTRIYPKPPLKGRNHISAVRDSVLERIHSANRISAVWRPALQEYICRRSAPPRGRFWLALRRGVLPDGVLRYFAVDILDYVFPEHPVVSVLRKLEDCDSHVWIPPEKCSPTINADVVAMRPVLREAKAVMTESFPTEIFLEDALVAARSISNQMFEYEPLEFEKMLEILARRTSKWRNR